MRALLVAILMTAPGFGLASAQEASDPNAAAEACIRENVERVERAIESLSDATTFLTQQLCAAAVVESVREAERLQQDAYSARLRQMCEDGELSGGLIGVLGGYDPCGDDNLPTVTITEPGPMSGGYLVSRLPPEATSLAASLLLEARLARLAAQAE